MSLDEGISRFIGRLYEAVYEPDAWRTAMFELMARTGSRLAFVACADVRHRACARSDFYHTDDNASAIAADEYAAGMHEADPSLIWASQHPEAGVCNTATLMAPEEFRQLEYVKWQESRLGTVHWRVFYTQPVDDISFALSLHPPASDGPASKEQGLLHKLLFEHLARALRLAARPPDLAGSSEAVIILDTAGETLTMSPRAERLVCQGDGLKLEGRRLRAGSPEITARLDLAIKSAISSASLGGAGGGVRLPRSNGLADWLALVSPCPHFLEHLPVQIPAAVLRIVDTVPHPKFSKTHAELFDLSPRESEVAQALLDGHSVESLCASLGISRNTGKAHLKSLFRKTATTRQSELVHLLSQLTRD